MKSHSILVFSYKDKSLPDLQPFFSYSGKFIRYRRTQSYCGEHATPPSSSSHKNQPREDQTSQALADAKRCRNSERPAAAVDPIATVREAEPSVDHRRVSPVRRSRRDRVPSRRLFDSAVTDHHRHRSTAPSHRRRL
ncbi:unnamed protein product [Microthlaspi erraticum]|uniref:Uncharacterized protein n=1 Tax=Microthlaspi erraticum TaxID=1685480 RepID=A0A6D2IK20_9BRAS|nr:unnamed protein product [Microthlaspi erraticum]